MRETMELVRHVDARGDFGYRLLKALGMEGRRVAHITIDIPGNGLAKVTITEYLHNINVDVDETQEAIIALLETSHE